MCVHECVCVCTSVCVCVVSVRERVCVCACMLFERYYAGTGLPGQPFALFVFRNIKAGEINKAFLYTYCI